MNRRNLVRSNGRYLEMVKVNTYQCHRGAVVFGKQIFAKGLTVYIVRRPRDRQIYQIPFLGKGSVNTLSLLGSTFLIM
jgi:hypothetical protein